MVDAREAIPKLRLRLPPGEPLSSLAARTEDVIPSGATRSRRICSNRPLGFARGDNKARRCKQLPQFAERTVAISWLDPAEATFRWKFFAVFHRIGYCSTQKQQHLFRKAEDFL